MNKIIIATIMRPQGETGVQTHFNNFIHYLSLQNVDHQLITPFSYYKSIVYPVFALRRVFGKLSGPLSVWWYRYWHAYFLKLALRQHLKVDSNCVIYAQCPLSAAAALNARVSDKQIVVMVAHFNVSQADEWVGKGLISDGDRLYRSIQCLEENILPRLNGLVFVSKFMQQELITRIPAIANIASTIVPNFLTDPGLPKPMEPIADLINIGTLERRKNQQYLLEIIAALRKQGSPLTLTIVGDGPDRKMLENNARLLKIDDLVSFSGFVENAAEQISVHKAYIHVAKLESFGITLIEAMARGRPVLAVPAGGVAEVLGDGAGGLSLPSTSADVAARIVADAIYSQEWINAAGKAARARFLNEYSSNVVAKRLENFLQDVRRVH